MPDPAFLAPPVPLALAEIAEFTGATLVAGDAAARISGVATLDRAGSADVAYIDSGKYVGAARRSAAGAVICAPAHANGLPTGMAVLVTSRPQRAFALVGARLFPAAGRPGPVATPVGIVAAGAHVHPSARIEAGATIDVGAVIAEGVEVGAGTVIGPGVVLGPHVKIGRDGAIGAGATLFFALLGNRVIVHPGVRIGQDGFGYVSGRDGHLKVPQIGRVIIQDDVEIGANSTIDRGSLRDTVIGEGTKIDNLVQIAHNVVIGRHCLLVAQVGISGSTTIGDFVVIGGQSGVVSRVKIGAGAQIGAKSAVWGDVPAGERWVGIPARPGAETLRGYAVLRRLARKRGAPAAGREDGVTDGEE